jgi:hypothetical protein
VTTSLEADEEAGIVQLPGNAPQAAPGQSRGLPRGPGDRRKCGRVIARWLGHGGDDAWGGERAADPLHCAGTDPEMFGMTCTSGRPGVARFAHWHFAISAPDPSHAVTAVHKPVRLRAARNMPPVSRQSSC